ncbi:MAG: hypothetical protein R3B07_37265 [Polyangiaceae bacterium]
MLMPRTAPFPFEAVRDLIGILRAMYVAERVGRHDVTRLKRIQAVAERLQLAQELALEHEPETLGHAAAWRHAERATQELGELVDLTTPLEPTLEAASRRVTDVVRSDARGQGLKKRRSRG